MRPCSVFQPKDAKRGKRLEAFTARTSYRLQSRPFHRITGSPSTAWVPYGKLAQCAESGHPRLGEPAPRFNPRLPFRQRKHKLSLTSFSLSRVY